METGIGMTQMASSKNWHEAWKTGQTGWRQRSPNPSLVETIKKMEPFQRKELRVFVPLCGDSIDMVWLYQEGVEVVGVELVGLAIQQFFDSVGVKPQRRDDRENGFTIWRAENITIYEGDLFRTTASMATGVSLCYDRAAMIALPADVRSAYCRHLQRILPACPWLLQTVTYPQEAVDGPPFSIDESEVRLYFSAYKVQTVQTEDRTATQPKFQQAGIEQVLVSHYWLQPLSRSFQQS